MPSGQRIGLATALRLVPLVFADAKTSRRRGSGQARRLRRLEHFPCSSDGSLPNTSGTEHNNDW